MPQRKTAPARPLESPEPAVRLTVQVKGIVQGVGFRPFVYRLAHELGLSGWVANTVHGIRLEAEGSRTGVERFMGRLRAEAPPMARIVSLRSQRLPSAGYDSFVIRASESESRRSVLVAPDSAVCPDCLAEMRRPSDRRYRYPFINCTNCGPRFTIIRDIPYDRALTTMAAFEMCPDCRAEFENPLDRRFHAQPIACPACGPRVSLVGRDGANVTTGAEEPIVAAGGAILAGKVLAVKGLGGFHLAVDATNEAAVEVLRQRKRRQGKPFAVMFPDSETAGRYCRLNRTEARALAGPERPIVLLRARAGSALSAGVAPGQVTVGAMLPYTPLHYLLIEAAGNCPLVLTSGNYSDEPIAQNNAEALARLAGIAELFLLHDRPIHTRADDSVVQVAGGKSVPTRRSRGYVPAPVRLRKSQPPVLAVGGQLKNTLCLTRGSDAFLSQHVGDIEDAETYAYFLDTLARMRYLLEVTPERVACDLHPDYLSTRWAHRESGLPVVGVQHHHAHVASCMAEHGLSGKVLGVALDGTGYGGDGTIWGGEFLVADERSFERAGHLPYVALPGGDAAVRETWRTARSVLGAALGRERLDSLGLAVWEGVGRKKVEAVDRMLEAGINCPLSSGCGRLFDAVAAVTGLRTESLYEGQAAIELEACALRATYSQASHYEFEVCERDGKLVPELGSMWEALARDVASEVRPAYIARGFHECLARLCVALAARIAGERGVDRVVLSGGVFNNRLLTGQVLKGLRETGLRAFSHCRVPPGDGGLSLGQALVTAQAEI